MRDDGRLSSDDERRGYSSWACVTSLRQRADLLADASATQSTASARPCLQPICQVQVQVSLCYETRLLIEGFA